jgi:hypothetical protein
MHEDKRLPAVVTFGIAFFPPEEETEADEDEPEESCPLAIVAIALKNRGELIDMPGTREYGRRTVAARTGGSRK